MQTMNAAISNAGIALINHFDFVYNDQLKVKLYNESALLSAKPSGNLRKVI